MQFNSVEYFFFLIPIFIVFWFFNRRNLNMRNLCIVLASYTFYGFWDWRFLGLLVFSSFCDFLIGRQFLRFPNRKKMLLSLSIIINLGVLFFFKYFDFFVQSFVDLFYQFGVNLHVETLNIILPVGISFYTFQTLSYTIDIYRGNLKPTKNILSFFAFVSFFPQLVAGPIERASKLLPQFEELKKFDITKAKSGLRLILWGLVQKVVIADMCAQDANLIFNNYSEMNGATLFLGAVLFAFQIYGDFAGYSNMAIGTARLFNIDLMQNFNRPYLSIGLEDFWRRWHISLSSWFRDYLYIPLGGSRRKVARVLLNISIVFLVSGLWHGAKLTFVIWGAIHAIFYLPALIAKHGYKSRKINPFETIGSKIPKVIKWGGTFFVVCVAWVYFRSENIQEANEYVSLMFSDLLSYPGYPGLGKLAISLIGIFFVLEWVTKKFENPLNVLLPIPRWSRWVIYYGLIILIVYIGSPAQTFIYFQF